MLEIEKYEAVKAKERQGARNDLENIPELIPESEKGDARDKAATAVGVNSHYVSDAKTIEAASPTLAEQVKAGNKTITQAKREIKELKREDRREENKQKLAQVPPGHRTARGRRDALRPVPAAILPRLGRAFYWVQERNRQWTKIYF